MSHKRVYNFDPATGTLRPAWSENEEWGPAKASGGSVRGEIVVGESGPDQKRRWVRRQERAA